MAVLKRRGDTRSPYVNRLNDLKEKINIKLKTTGVTGLTGYAGKEDTGILAIEQFENAPEASGADRVDAIYSTLHSAQSSVKALFSDLFVGQRTVSKNGRLGTESAEYEPENKDLNDDESLTDAQIESGAVAAVAAHDPVAYAKAALRELDAGADVNAAPDIEGTMAVESYDNENVSAMLPFSIIYNTLAARQGPLAEAFFPTQVLTPDTPIVITSVTRSVLMNDFRHKDSGRVVDLGRINLADAALDASILSRSATRMIPVFLAGVNEDNFHSDFNPVPAISDGIEVLTAPLKVDEELDFTGICQAGMAHNAGEGDWSDSIANPVYLQTAYFKLTAKGNKTSIIGIDLGSQARAIFSKKTQGQEMEMGLQYLSEQLVLSATTRDKDGNLAEALDFLRDPTNAGRFLHFGASLNGTIFLNSGNLEVHGSKGKIKRVWVEQNGVVNVIDDETVLASIKSELLSIEFVAYTLDANRSNLNRAQRGDLTDTFEQREMWAVGLGTPITAIIPTTDTRSTSDLLGPITATRLRNDNNAITKLYEVSKQLEEAKISYNKHLPRIENIEGVARWVITPFYERINASVFDLLNNLRSADKQPDVQMAIVNLIREVVYRAYRDSNYETALRMQTGVEGEKPKVLIGTDTVLANHLIIQGDARLAGLNFESEIFTSVDRRLGELGQDTHDMFVTFTRGIPLDPMSFGTFLWMPELATTLQISREGGRTSNEVMVQPRCRHIIQLPILIHITINDLGAALVQKASIDFSPV